MVKIQLTWETFATIVHLFGVIEGQPFWKINIHCVESRISLFFWIKKIQNVDLD